MAAVRTARRLVASRPGDGGRLRHPLLLSFSVSGLPEAVSGFRRGMAHPHRRANPGDRQSASHRSLLVHARRPALVRLGMGIGRRGGRSASRGRADRRGSVLRRGDRRRRLALVPAALGAGWQFSAGLRHGAAAALHLQHSLAGAPARHRVAVSTRMGVMDGAATRAIHLEGRFFCCGFHRPLGQHARQFLSGPADRDNLCGGGRKRGRASSEAVENGVGPHFSDSADLAAGRVAQSLWLAPVRSRLPLPHRYASCCRALANFRLSASTRPAHGRLSSQ